MPVFDTARSALPGTSELFNGPQSAFDPHGPVAGEIAELAWLLVTGGASVFALVTIIAVAAVVGPRRVRVRIAGATMIIGGGVVLPVVALTALLLRAFLPVHDAAAADAPLRIEVVAEQWWWRIRYLDDAGALDFATANELRIPVGRRVELSLVSADVIHSFWIPKLAGKVDMVPGQVGSLRLRADRAGTFRGQCAEYCGAQHARMAFVIVAEPDGAFEAWRARQRPPASQPASEAATRGMAAFGARGCGVCHTIRGTDAAGVRGPDLTHVGDRSSLGAGTLEPGAASLATWIGAGQHVKPGNLMPSYPFLPPDELNAIAIYLDGLR